MAKYVIDIPDIEYEHITNKEKYKSLSDEKAKWLIDKTLNRIADATPLEEVFKNGLLKDCESCEAHFEKVLEDIKAEIEEHIKNVKCSNDTFQDFYETGERHILEIIDKHISGKIGDNK